MDYVESKMLIGGELVDSSGSERIDVINPATEEIVGSVPKGNAEDADRVI